VSVWSHFIFSDNTCVYRPGGAFVRGRGGGHFFWKNMKIAWCSFIHRDGRGRTVQQNLSISIELPKTGRKTSARWPRHRNTRFRATRGVAQRKRPGAMAHDTPVDEVVLRCVGELITQEVASIEGVISDEASEALVPPDLVPSPDAHDAVVRSVPVETPLLADAVTADHNTEINHETDWDDVLLRLKRVDRGLDAFVGASASPIDRDALSSVEAFSCVSPHSGEKRPTSLGETRDANEASNSNDAAAAGTPTRARQRTTTTVFVETSPPFHVESPDERNDALREIAENTSNDTSNDSSNDHQIVDRLVTLMTQSRVSALQGDFGDLSLETRLVANRTQAVALVKAFYDALLGDTRRTGESGHDVDDESVKNVNIVGSVGLVPKQKPKGTRVETVAELRRMLAAF
jgi:hypothetical protein